MSMNMDVELDGLFRQNGTYDYDADYMNEEDIGSKASQAVLIPVLYSVELVLGLLGNGLLLAVLAQKRRSWSISDTFILHLSVADILLLGTLPFWAAQAAQKCGWCFGGFLCKISGALFNINFYCGIFLLVCISLDHYLSAVHSIQLYSQKKPTIAHISCLLAWLVSLSLAIPDCIFLMVKNDSAQDKKTCGHSYSKLATGWQLASRLLHHILGFLLPAAALLICCIFILLRGSGGPKKRRALVVMLPLIVVFFLCWVPYNITLIVDTIRSSSKEPEASLTKALRITSALGCLHACLRPLLYMGLCRNFRKRVLAMLRCDGHESESSLWEMGVGGEVLPDQNHKGEEQKQMTGGDHQVQSTQC